MQELGKGRQMSEPVSLRWECAVLLPRFFPLIFQGDNGDSADDPPRQVTLDRQD